MAERVAMLIDVSRCTGCRGCQVACKQWNQLPAEKSTFKGSYQNPANLSAKTWTLVNFIEPDDFNKDPRWLFRKSQCLHCGEASCLQACPTGAIRKSDSGIVYINQDICTGCKYCVEVCPFGTPHPDHDSGTAKKCRMCLDRVENGLTPACAKACPTGAVSFGSRRAMLSLAAQRKLTLAKTSPGSNPYLYGETALGGLGVMYLLSRGTPELFRLPKDPRRPMAKIAFKWLLGILPGMAALYGIWRYMQKNEEPESASVKGK